MAIPTDGLRVPKALLEDVQQVFALTDQFCSERLLAEYAGLCRELLARLSRSRTARR
jgi:hypothetical protein